MEDQLCVEWHQNKLDGPFPLGRSSHTINAVGHTLYVFGGENQPRIPVDNELYAYDMKTQSWSKVECTGDRPSPRIAHASAVVGDDIYFFGGRTGIEMGEGSLNDMYRFDTANKKWEKLDCSGAVPSPRSFHAMTAVNNKLYVFGGCASTGRLNDLYVCDLENVKWAPLPSHEAILPRGGPGFVSVGNYLYVVAGFTGDEVDDMYRFDLDSETWHDIKADPNIPRISVFGLGSVGSLIFLHGGEVSPSAEGHAGAGEYSDVTYAFDTSSTKSQWKVVTYNGTVKPSARGWHSACSLDDGIAIHGGNSFDNTRLEDSFFMTINLKK